LNIALPLLLTGLATGLSLIVAIGAQNAYVLRTGLAGRHVIAVVASALRRTSR
jgi:L-lysine exporter family protein LysE/ArgO